MFIATFGTAESSAQSIPFGWTEVPGGGIVSMSGESGVRAVENGGSRILLTVRGLDNLVYLNDFFPESGTATGWYRPTFMWTAAMPALTRTSSEDAYVIHMAGDGVVYVLPRSGNTWGQLAGTPPIPSGGNILTPPAAGFLPLPNNFSMRGLHVFAADNNGKIYRTWRTCDGCGFNSWQEMATPAGSIETTWLYATYSPENNEINLIADIKEQYAVYKRVSTWFSNSAGDFQPFAYASNEYTPAMGGIASEGIGPAPTRFTRRSTVSCFSNQWMIDSELYFNSATTSPSNGKPFLTKSWFVADMLNVYRYGFFSSFDASFVFAVSENGRIFHHRQNNADEHCGYATP